MWRKYPALSFLQYSPHLLTRIGPIAQSLSAPSDEHFPMSDTAKSYDSLASYILALPPNSPATSVQIRTKTYRFATQACFPIPQAPRNRYGWWLTRHERHIWLCEIGGLFATPMLLLTVIAKCCGIRHRCKLNWIVDIQAAISKVSINI